MKRLWVILGALAVFCALSVGTASAAVRFEQPIQWRVADNLDAGTFTQTARKPLASEVIDTSGVFSLNDCSFSGPGNAIDNFASQDSVLIGYLVIYSDTTGDVASTLTAVTATFDASGDGNDWAVAGTAAGILASDDPIVALPIVQRAGLDHQSLFAMAPKLRVRFTSATGIMQAAKLKIVYWVDK